MRMQNALLLVLRHLPVVIVSASQQVEERSRWSILKSSPLPLAIESSLSSAVKSSKYNARINRQISNYIESNRYPIEQNQQNKLK